MPVSLSISNHTDRVDVRYGRDSRGAASGREHELGFLLQSGHTPKRLFLD